MSAETKGAFIAGMEAAGAAAEDVLENARAKLQLAQGATAAFTEATASIQNLLEQQRKEAGSAADPAENRWLARAGVAMDGLRRKAEMQQIGLHAVVAAHEALVKKLKSAVDVARASPTPQHPGPSIATERKEGGDASNA